MKDPEFVEDLRSNVLSFAGSDCQGLECTDERIASFAAPRGYVADAERRALHARALEYASTLKVPYIDAVVIASGGRLWNL